MRYMGSGRSGAFQWLFQRVSGVALVILLGLHFLIIHYWSWGPVSYDKVAPRLISPYYKAWEILFLALAVYHAMNGVKLVIDDYVHHPVWRIVLTSLNWLLWLATLIFGVLTVVTFTYQP